MKNTLYPDQQKFFRENYSPNSQGKISGPNLSRKMLAIRTKIPPNYRESFGQEKLKVGCFDAAVYDASKLLMTCTIEVLETKSLYELFFGVKHKQIMVERQE